MPRGVCGSCGTFTYIGTNGGVCGFCMPERPRPSIQENDEVSERAENLAIRWMGMSDTHRLYLEYTNNRRQALVGAEPLPNRGGWVDGFKIFYDGHYYNIRRHRSSQKWFCSCARRFASNSDDPCVHLRTLNLSRDNQAEETRLIVEPREQITPSVPSVNRIQNHRARIWTGFDSSAEAWAERDRSFAQNHGENKPVNTEAASSSIREIPWGPRQASAEFRMTLDDSAKKELNIPAKPEKPTVQKFGGKRTFAADDEEV